MAILLHLLLLLQAPPARAGESYCAEIETEFSMVEKADFSICDDADRTRHRFALQLPELLKGCRELAAYAPAPGAPPFQEQSRRFRSRVIYELLTSPADEREFQRESREAQACQAALEPLMSFRQHALARLLRLEDEMNAKLQAPEQKKKEETP